METRWNQIDAAAEREAQALQRARAHRSAFQRRTARKIMDREQAVWEEHLSEHSRSCYYCGRLLQDTMASDRRKRDTTFIDVCGPCAFLHDLVKRVEDRHARYKRGGHYGRRQNRKAVRV